MNKGANKKFMYPESSVPYSIYLKPEDPQKVFEQLDKPKDVVLEPRPTFLRLGALASKKGSAYMEYGNTKVIASVEPPRELSSKQPRRGGALGIITCSLKYAPFATADKESIARKEISMSASLKKALEPMICRNEFQNFQLEIKVIVLDDDGCALSTAINCCGAALVEGGIPTYDLITAATVCLYKGVDFINPTAAVERLFEGIDDNAAEEEHGIVVIANLTAVSQVAECFQKGYLTLPTLERLSAHAVTINGRILETVRYVLVNKVKDFIAKEKIEEERNED